MDFSIDSKLEADHARLKAFVTKHIVPLEADKKNFDAPGSPCLPALPLN